MFQPKTECPLRDISNMNLSHPIKQMILLQLNGYKQHPFNPNQPSPLRARAITNLQSRILMPLIGLFKNSLGLAHFKHRENSVLNLLANHTLIRASSGLEITYQLISNHKRL